MKLPRWRVIGMLTTSVLALLAAAGWWWVTWPKRTFDQFREAANAGRSADRKRLTEDKLLASMKEFLSDSGDSSWTLGIPPPVPQSLTDRFRGRQDSEFRGAHGIYRFRVERGRAVDILSDVEGGVWISFIDP